MLQPPSSHAAAVPLPMVSSRAPPRMERGHPSGLRRSPRTASAFRFTAREIVLQPTTLCNLACDYCYLSEKHLAHHMPVNVVRKVADYIRGSSEQRRILWHCGEPLSIGVERFRALLEPLAEPGIRDRVRHVIQTNATLIDQTWCDLFREYDFQIGVSIDGPRHLNTRRVNRAGRSTFARVLEGINHLRDNDLPFSVLAVVDVASLQFADDIYEFVHGLGAEMLCINIEQTKGVHESEFNDAAGAKRFWRSLYDVWKEEMILPVREFDRTIKLMNDVANGGRDLSNWYRTVELMPSISAGGDVYLLSPEFVGVEGVGYDFVVGNLAESSLDTILRSPMTHSQVQDFVDGIEMCGRECQYFSFCGGGYGSNKYFETGTLATTETQYCRNKIQALTDSLLEAMEDEAR